jgi:hypothetical protein
MGWVVLAVNRKSWVSVCLTHTVNVVRESNVIVKYIDVRLASA